MGRVYGERSSTVKFTETRTRHGCMDASDGHMDASDGCMDASDAHTDTSDRCTDTVRNDVWMYGRQSSPPFKLNSFKIMVWEVVRMAKGVQFTMNSQ